MSDARQIIILYCIVMMIIDEISVVCVPIERAILYAWMDSLLMFGRVGRVLN